MPFLGLEAYKVVLLFIQKSMYSLTHVFSKVNNKMTTPLSNTSIFIV